MTKQNLLLAFGVSLALQITIAAAEPLESGTVIGNEANTTLLSNTGGNEFTFEGGAANAPGLPSFAGGPCTGAAYGASTSLAGVAIGGGRTTMDDSCQRRNWVQTLVGASQHMPPEERAAMLRVAVEVMKDDPYLSGAFIDLGYKAPETEVAAEANTTLGTKSSNEPPTDVVFAKTCNVVVAGNVEKTAVAALEAKGCRVDHRSSKVEQ